MLTVYGGSNRSWYTGKVQISVSSIETADHPIYNSATLCAACNLYVVHTGVMHIVHTRYQEKLKRVTDKFVKFSLKYAA